MEVVNNVIKINSNNRCMTTVSIEDIDESWALQLLNECETDDELITVQDKKIIDGQISTEIEDSGASILSLTAIENQMLALAEKQEAQARAEQEDKLKSNFNMARIKRFFLA